MRKAKVDPGELRDKILQSAGPFLKRHGAAPVDEIMKAAGLTSGALYSHFKNKEELCTQAICRELDAAVEMYRARIRDKGRQELKEIVAEYLGGAHVGEVDHGCTFAALGSEMAKASPRAKRAYEQRIHAFVDVFAEALGTGPAGQRRARAQQIWSTMLGALTFARAMSDADAAKELLAHVRARTLRELDEE